ncbi:unnamed protein product, partial [marine sediment metagenome]
GNEFMILSLQQQVTCHTLYITKLTGKLANRITNILSAKRCTLYANYILTINY